VVPDAIQVWILLREPSVVRIKGNCLLQMVHGFVRSVSHTERNRHDVVGVIAFGVFP
jgi:hypothetical protein